jgi:hypothetical protein
MVQTYPLMMVLIGITIQWLSAQILQMGLLVTHEFVCFPQCFQSWQYENKILDSRE